jgi:tRNA1(Val) A37 N6-methylase TrmN6
MPAAVNGTGTTPSERPELGQDVASQHAPSQHAPSQLALAHDPLTDDALAGELRVWQRRKGHRYSLDDTLTAWVAAHAALREPALPERALDLGCGIGSVLLMLAYKLPTARLFGLEAQTQSFALACSNVARNQLEGRVSVELGDLRQPQRLESLVERSGGRFMLVTGTPPYLPPEHGTVPPDSQRAHARFELRGGVEAYMQAAAQVLHPDGLFVMCAGARADDRIERAAQQASLRIHEVLPVVPSVSKGVLFSVWTFRPAANADALKHTLEHSRAPLRLAPFVARDALGGRTQLALDLRAFFGLPLPQGEPSSPALRSRKRAAREQVQPTGHSKRDRAPGS